MHAFYLAWQYIRHNRIKSVLLVCGVTLTIVVPAAVFILVRFGEEWLMSRAASTPMVIGAKGSRVDLSLHALYFRSKAPAPIGMAEAAKLREAGLAIPVPLYGRFTARSFPIVGATLDYFDFRDLRVASGHQIAKLGDCVLGARVAQALALGAGDRLLSDSENVLDLSGAYPLNMRVTGVLAEERTEDDFAVFVDLKTAWVIAGLGHGHQDVSKADESVILDRTGNTVVANAALPEYTEITDENIGSFHFHGDPAGFPITALIALPRDEKSAVLLRGRYEQQDAAAQLVIPEDVVGEIMEMVFKAQRIFNYTVVCIAAATVLFLVLIISLSLRLRSTELQTLHKLGCSRHTMITLVGAELILIGGISSLFSAGALVLVLQLAPVLMRTFLA
ncbi:MAG: hypothetical protein HYV27_02780 [Candidatus Hydrogenedentes bacterium]|nr:hypothetical protein [Candidatus Hydrogenedentota bacterium]